MVPLLLLKNARMHRGRLARWRRCSQTSLILLGIAFLVPAVQAQTFVTNITTTTYLDSRVSNQTNNYGHAHTVKVVIDNNVTSDGSICRGLFQFPPQLWTYSLDDIVSASVSFYVWQDNTGPLNVTLFPLTKSFVQGTGTGTYPPDGATWLTYDGTNSWTNPGGDFDSGSSVVAVKGPILSDENDRFFTWDITALLKTSTSRAELQNYGAMLRIDETPVPTTGMPRAPFTSSYDPSYTPGYWPTLQVTLRPSLLHVTMSNGVISFGITNLTVGVTNTVERSFNLTATNGWTAVSSFVATGSSTNWSETIQPGWTNAFYRVHTQF